MTAAELKAVPFKATAERMMTLGELCDLVAGRVPLVIELKSHFDGDRRLVERAAEVLAGYARTGRGDVVRSGQIATLARRSRRSLPRGIVAESAITASATGTGCRRRAARHGFCCMCPARAPAFRRLFGQRPARDRAAGRAQVFGLPLLTWTVRSAEQRARAARYADQMIFEGFRP